MRELYRDSGILCDEEGITILRYYLPWSGAKRVLYSRIRSFEVHDMGPFSGQYRIWGGTLRHWLNWDTDRPGKSRLIILVTDQFVRPVITPDDPEAVLSILRERVGRRAAGPAYRDELEAAEARVKAVESELEGARQVVDGLRKKGDS